MHMYTIYISLFVLGIDSLFSKINCEKGAIDDMLGTNQGVTDQNLLQYLGVIEERTNELLLTSAYVSSQKVCGSVSEDHHQIYIVLLILYIGSKPSEIGHLCVLSHVSPQIYFCHLSYFYILRLGCTSVEVSTQGKNIYFLNFCI